MAVSTETKVGVFVIVGLALLLAGTLIVEDINPFRRGYTLKAYFSTVEGLMPGNVVTMAGVECGKVKDMRLSDGRVEVILQIDEGTAIPGDSVASVAIQTVLGGKKVALKMGSLDTPPLKPGDIVQSEDVLSITDLATELVRKLDDLMNENAPKVTEIVSNFEELSNDLKAGKGLLGKVLTDEALYNDVVEVAATARKIMDEEGPKFAQVVDDLAEITSQVREGEGAIAKLLRDDEAYQNLLQASRDLREVTAIARELASEKTEDLEALLAAGPKIYEAAETLHKFIDEMDKGEGTLRLLLEDPSLYNEAKALVTEVRGAVEDIREQVPAATFITLVGGVAQ